jgi:hypothetical protein
MRKPLLLLLAFCLLLLSSLALAQGGYELSWWTVDGGGSGASEDGGYSLGGTAGQADAGAMASGGYRLTGGFWGGGMPRHGVYLPLVLRNR